MSKDGDGHVLLDEGSVPLGMMVWWLLVAGLGLYGVLFVYSTGYVGDAYPVRATWTRHLIWLCLGCGLAWLASCLSPDGLAMRYAVWLGYGASILGLLLVFGVGTKIGGARRWLPLGPVMIQPAEFAKIFTLLAVCRVVSLSRGWRRCLYLILTVGLPFVLIALEPSVGNAFSLLPGTLVVLGIHGLWRKLWILLVLGTVICILGTGATVLWIRHQGGAERLEQKQAAGIFRGYHFRRLSSYLTPKGAWNERQSMMTLGSGGLTGKGYLEGTMKGLGFLPRTVAPTDFIFSVVGEELGFFFGVLPVLLMYMGVLGIGLHWAGCSKDDLSCLSAVSILTLLFTHIIVNVGMTVRMVPVIGLPLPLLSYGGSFTMACALGLGLVYGTGKRYYEQRTGRAHGNAQTPTEFCIRLLGILKIRIVSQGR